MSFKVPERHYLVCYDYGMGGVWWFVKARSSSEIRAASPELIVFEEVPEWMRDDHWKAIVSDDLRSPRTEALRGILTKAK